MTVPNMRHHFDALITKINPPEDRVRLASRRVGEVRDWLKDHEFATRTPHTLLSGSYGRKTAIELIPDVDTLLFLPDDQEDRTPNAVLLEVHRVLKEYPGAGEIDVKGQRRSVRLHLPDDHLYLDIVPSITPDGVDKPLLVPDRPQQEWVASDPLGYAKRLSTTNGEHGEKVVPLVKLFKVWRDEHMIRRRPKSYVLEVMLLYGVEDGTITLTRRSRAENVHDLFAYVADKYADLMDNGKEAPRIRDPQITDKYITRGWSREEFETFMRRVREARRAAERALAAESEEDAVVEWEKVFGSRWPSQDDVREAVLREGQEHQPGQTKISPEGRVIGGAAVIPTLPTRYHGG